MSSLSLKSFAVAACLGLAASSLPLEGLAQSRALVQAGANQQLVNLPRSTSMSINLPTDARDIVVSNPQVADAVLHSARRITLLGVAAGETDVLFLDAAGRVILSLRVRVDAGTAALHDTLSRVMPGTNVRAEAVSDSIILSGTAATPAEAQRAVQLARAFVSGPEKVINLIGVTGSDQVMLKVRVVEVQRTVMKQLGVSTELFSRDGIHTYGFGKGAGYGVSGQQGGTAGLCLGQDSINTTAAACLEAFERVGLVRTLAEPHLASVNGEASSFLAGGELPVPASRDRDGQVSLEFKPYGVALAFRPVVMDEGRINLQLKVEVSELSPNGGITIGAGTPQSLTVPGLNVRRTENTIEIPSGGSMMIAGLLQESTRQSVDALPGLTNVPILGNLFRSRDYLMGETELVVIVEPYIVSPTSPDRLQTPADGLLIADDASAIFFGQLNQVYGTASATSGGNAWQGPVGYVIE